MSTLPVIGPNRGLVFDMRITLGNIITFVMIGAAILIDWGRMTDELELIRAQQVQQQIINDKQLNLIQSMQITQAQQQSISEEMQRRLGILEEIEGLGGKKH